MTDRAAELPCTEEGESPNPDEYGDQSRNRTVSDGFAASPSSQPSPRMAPRIEESPTASTASGPVALPNRTRMKPEAESWVQTRMFDCSCGGRFRVHRHTPDADIRRHNRTNQHLAWRMRHDVVQRRSDWPL